MVSKYSIFFVLYVFVFCDAGYVPSFNKCYIKDEECSKYIMQSIFTERAESGIEELNIPPLDPLPLKDVTVKVLDMIDITLVDGTVKGLKDCITDKFETDMEKERSLVELTCDIKVEGKYKVFSNNPTIREFLKGFGGPSGEGALSVNGEGHGKVEIKKLKLRMEFFFKIVKRDGEIYFKNRPKKTKYDYDIGEIRFFADKIYLGDVESSKLVTKILDDNWKLFLNPFASPFAEKAMSLCIKYFNNFLDRVPCKDYLLDDFSQYVRE